MHLPPPPSSSPAAAPTRGLLFNASGRSCRLCPSLQTKEEASIPNPSPFHSFFTIHRSNPPSQSLRFCFPNRYCTKPICRFACASKPDQPFLQQTECLGDWQDGKKGVTWEADQIAEAIGGRLITKGCAGTICTDTRLLDRGEWFLALCGPRLDGHCFQQQALEKGCSGVIARAVPSDWPAGFVQVADTMDALLCIAAHVRKKYSGPVVGITGSCGKTTTRLMTSLALESLGHIHQTHGNLNNRYGVPLSILKMPSCSAACVLELGMNHPGEILELSRVSQPTIRVILNAGPAHMQNFGSVEDIAAAKGELFADAQPGDVCVVNADDPLVMGLFIPQGIRVVRFGSSENCHMKLRSAKLVRGGLAVSLVLEHWVNELEPQAFVASPWSTGDDCKNSLGVESLSQLGNHGKESGSIGSSLSDTGFNHTNKTAWRCKSSVEFEIPSPGLHLALNACAAAAVAMLLDASLLHVAESLSKYYPLSMRSRYEELDSGVFLIDDSYNANPMSMKAAIGLLESIDSKGRKIALLGDMLELGDLTKQAHMEALRLCQSSGVSMMGLAGPVFMESVHRDEAERVHLMPCHILCCPDSTSLAAEIVSKLRKKDVILVKGSRSMQMEVVVTAIKQTSQFL
ncbi:hypothetical protein O6H91_Y209200 [Diphasiastrum complanatum]|nr:hypothetical protein O6H91_Y209200 [Diphasiastrum complanatum]